MPRPYEGLAGLADALCGRDAASAVRLSYVYVPDITSAPTDTVPARPELAVLGAFDDAMVGLARRLPAGARLVISADHGFIDIDDRAQLCSETPSPCARCCGSRRQVSAGSRYSTSGRAARLSSRLRPGQISSGRTTC